MLNKIPLGYVVGFREPLKIFEQDSDFNIRKLTLAAYKKQMYGGGVEVRVIWRQTS